MGSATAELQNQRLRQPTDAKGEPEVVHGITDCQSVTCMVQWEGADRQPNCPQAPDDACADEHGDAAGVEDLLGRLQPTRQLIEGFPSDPRLEADAFRRRPFPIANMQVRPVGHRDGEQVSGEDEGCHRPLGDAEELGEFEGFQHPWHGMAAIAPIEPVRQRNSGQLAGREAAGAEQVGDDVARLGVNNLVGSPQFCPHPCDGDAEKEKDRPKDGEHQRSHAHQFRESDEGGRRDQQTEPCPTKAHRLAFFTPILLLPDGNLQRLKEPVAGCPNRHRTEGQPRT